MSAWSALLSSFAEVQQVLLEQGVKLDVKGVRRVAYRYAERARVLHSALLSANFFTIILLKQ